MGQKETFLAINYSLHFSSPAAPPPGCLKTVLGRILTQEFPLFLMPIPRGQPPKIPFCPISKEFFIHIRHMSGLAPDSEKQVAVKLLVATHLAPDGQGPYMLFRIGDAVARSTGHASAESGHFFLKTGIGFL